MKKSSSLYSSPLARILLRVKRRRQCQSLRQIVPGLFSGGVPTETTLQALAARGIRQVVDLRQPHEKAGNEARVCEQLGLEYVALPMAESLPDFPATEQLLRRLSSTPTYLHCHHGSDRSGAIVALYRTVVQGWSLPQAGTELLRHGFNPHLEVLAHDICFYTRELRREPLKQALHRVATT